MLISDPFNFARITIENALLAEPNMEGPAQAVFAAISASVPVDGMRAGGLTFSAQISWVRELERLADELGPLATGQYDSPQPDDIKVIVSSLKIPD